MKQRLFVGIASALIPLVAVADVTVRSHEGGVREGKAWGETYAEYYGPQGLRVDVTSDGSSSPYMYFLLLHNPDRLYVVQGKSVTVVDRQALATLETKGGAPSTTAVRVSALGSAHSLNGFSCSGFLLRRRGLPSRYLCLALPASLNLPSGYVDDARNMRDMLVRLMAVVGRNQGGSSPKKKVPASFNPYGLPEGYPVHLWESNKGEVTWENQLLSITPGPVPTDMFRAPAPSE